MLTKKEYWLIASVIKELDAVDKVYIATTFADRLEFNPNFNRDKFLKACGIEAEGGKGNGR